MTTLLDFDWDVFRESIHTASWLEIGMTACLAFAARSSFYAKKRAESTLGTSLATSLFFAVGATLGVYRKLFYELDVVVFLYLIWLYFAFRDFRLSLRLRKSEEETLRRQRNDERRKRLSGRESGAHRAEKRSHRHSHRHSSNAEPKAPIFADPLSPSEEENK
ncbi:MAG: hypothetical protein II655_04375 [Thermoguttaceae bacterium]|nr:hypothetical protein [Thermoguttaceae bacterium]